MDLGSVISLFINVYDFKNGAGESGLKKVVLKHQSELYRRLPRGPPPNADKRTEDASSGAERC